MPCMDYHDHEAGIDHRHEPQWPMRWRASDGCSGTGCGACLPKVGLVSVQHLDSAGLPFDRDAWTYGDAIGNLLRSLGGAPAPVSAPTPAAARLTRTEALRAALDKHIAESPGSHDAFHDEVEFENGWDAALDAVRDILDDLLGYAPGTPRQYRANELFTRIEEFIGG